MAVQGSIIDYSGGVERDFTVYFKLAFTGSYIVAGDPLNCSGAGTLPLLNPNGLDIEGFFELPLTLGPSVYLQNLLGYTLQPSISVNTAGAFTGLTLANIPIMVYAPTTGLELGAVTYASLLGGNFLLGTAILSMTRRRV